MNLFSFAAAAVMAATTHILPAADLKAPARVVRIIDGDSIVVVRDGVEEKVRLACIDAPELGQGSPGKWAKEDVSLALLGDPEVTLKVYGKDRYGRTIAEVYRNRDGANVNLLLVEFGSAFAYWDYMSCDRNAYEAAEVKAQSGPYGVWRTQVQFPWEWRREN